MAEAKRTVKVRRKSLPEPVGGKSATGGVSRTRPTTVTNRKVRRNIAPKANSHSLYPARELVIAALLKQPNVTRAARSVGMSPSTLQKWLQTPEFSAEYRAAREAVLELSIASVGRYVTDAVETLGRNLTCGRSDSEIRAAAVILQWAGKFMPQEYANRAASKVEDAARPAGGATVIVVDGSEDDYTAALESVVP